MMTVIVIPTTFIHERHLNHRGVFKKHRDEVLAEWRQIAT